jgi:hypothetical protein
MPEFNESQVKKVLSATKDGRRQSANLRRADISERSRIRASRGPLENLAASHLTTAGFEIDKFEKIREQHHTELRHIVEERKAEAVKHSYYVKDALRYGVDSRVKNVELLPVPPKYELLNTPFLIWWTQGIDFPEIEYEPSNSRAKFALQSDNGITYDEMSFYFLWSNPSDRHAVINVDGYLVVDGFCRAGSEGGFLPGFRYSRVTLDAQLHLLEWWNHPPTEPFPQIDQSQEVLHLSTSTGGFMDSDAMEFEHVFRGYDLRYELFVIPPKETVVFEVALSMLYGSSHGSIDIDFTSGNFQVMCPAVLLAILT